MLVDALAENLPESSTLVLVGRGHRRDAAIGRLRLSPGVIDVTAADLALDISETEELLASMGLELGLDEVTDIASRFEGWPAGLRLAALDVQTHGISIARFAVADRVVYVNDYLRVEWAGRLDQSDLEFLREAACLGRFTGEMCDAVGGRRGSAARLRRLHRQELVVLPLDRRESWFRMHPLLARHLEDDLRESDRERWREIHLSAARCWEGEGDIDLALVHAECAGHLELCETLVARHAPGFFTRGLHATVARWLSIFPQDHLRTSWQLCGIGAIGAFAPR